MSGTGYPAVSYCKCINLWASDIISSVGSSGATTYNCLVGSSDIPVWTYIPPPTTATSSFAYAPWEFNIHSYENIRANEHKIEAGMHMLYSNISTTHTDADGKSVGYNETSTPGIHGWRYIFHRQ